MDTQTERMYDLMRKEVNRLKTFQMRPAWPKDYVDIKKLAKAGFFYAFSGDKVHCAFCRGQVCRWDRDDDPMAEHARHFTTCPFIMGGDVGNEPLGEDPFPGPKRPRPYDVCGMLPNSPPNPAGSLQHQAAIPQQQQQQPQPQPIQSQSQLQNQHREDTNHQYSSLYDPFNYDYSNHSINDTQNHETEVHQSHHTPAYDDVSLDRQTQHSPSNTSASSNCSNNSSNSLNGICKICYTNSIELVFLPCGHSLSCLSCATRLHSCPCCRSTITTRIRTFLV